jgi:hypothetical protein
MKTGNNDFQQAEGYYLIRGVKLWYQLIQTS